MKRSSPLKRAKPLRARKPMKKVNRARKARLSESQYGTPEFREWLHAQPCVVSGFSPSFSGLGPIEQAHVKSRGAGGTWRDTVPLRRALHQELHIIGQDSFEEKYGVNLRLEADEIQKQWADR